MSTGQTSEEKTRPTAAEPTRYSLFPGERPIDGRAKELADRREEGRRQARVLMAVRDYMGRRNRKRPCQTFEPVARGGGMS